MFGFLKKIFGSAQDRIVRRYFKTVESINEWDRKLDMLSDEALKAKTEEFRQRISQGESLDHILPEAYAVVKNACKRMSGTEFHVSGYDQRWDMVPYDVQMVGAIAMHNGAISEMQTGEGKTLTALMPLYLNALTGKPVHLVTVNDYLAQRDCQWVGVVLHWLGLTTGSLTNDVPTDRRKQIYLADVVYGTAAEFGFDYLRDNSMAMSREDQVQRGFYYAIIDEVDSILIDEARTPLIISGPSSVNRQMYHELKDKAAELVRLQRDFCNRLANEARRILDPLEEKSERGEKLNKEQEESRNQALRKLWLVAKGTPNNRILKKIKENPDMRAALDRWDLYFYADQNKDERASTLSQLYVIVDERSSEYEMTDQGIAAWHQIQVEAGEKKAEDAHDFVMLDISEEYIKIDEDSELNAEEKMQHKLAIQEEDSARKERTHNLRQLLRAHLLMEKDVDYIVQDGKIIIIDEHTGRPQPGRRFSDGLHQAIEAKEGVTIQRETQTFATITLQNFFRMYSKLAGMTGTATTEANEIKQIYKMDVLEIPTHRPCKRTDHSDEVYMTEREKYHAILQEVRKEHEKGRPILIGTESVEVSEKLSRIFRFNNLPHTVLNAKHNEKEAEIVAQAGRRGAITIATNMAGRGTDIKLEPGVADLGGLYVVGTTRHQSRRIDRQLRGRCARQGDPGSSKFYISFEDTLMRLFASPRLTSMLQRFRPPENEPISSPILDRSIQTAQKRVEGRNYTIRKHTLEYDDVMNKQRQEIYSFRNEVLQSDDIESVAIRVLEQLCAYGAEKFLKSRSTEGGWDPAGYRAYLMEHIPLTFEEDIFDDDTLDIEDLEKIARDRVVAAFREKLARENSKVPYAATLDESAPVLPPANEAVRNIMIRKADRLWQDHLLAMDHLRSDVNLRRVGQRDPLLEFKHEAFAMFEELSHRLYADIAQSLFRFEILTKEHPSLQQILKDMRLETHRSLVSEWANPAMAQGNIQPPEGVRSRGISMDSFNEEDDSKVVSLEPIMTGPKTNRNEQCPCGSGLKYKRCCGLREEREEGSA